jgi:hypothetical protein
MNEPRLPGFIADHSLYRTKRAYSTRRSGDFSQGQVMPAIISTGAKCVRICSTCARTGLESVCAACRRCEGDGFPD